jgi:hypothetical protein
MGASLADQAKIPCGVAVKHQVLAKDTDLLDRLFRRHFRRWTDRLPIAAQQFTCRRARSNLCHAIIVFARNHLFSFLRMNLSRDSYLFSPGGHFVSPSLYRAPPPFQGLSIALGAGDAIIEGRFG